MINTTKFNKRIDNVCSVSHLVISDLVSNYPHYDSRSPIIKLENLKAVSFANSNKKIFIQKLTVFGPLGSQSIILPKSWFASLNKENTILSLFGLTSSYQIGGEKSTKTDKKSLALGQTLKSQINQMIQGVNTGFIKKIQLNGIGYKVTYDINTESPWVKTLFLHIGFSNPAIFSLNVPNKYNINIIQSLEPLSFAETSNMEAKSNQNFIYLHSTNLSQLNNLCHKIVKLKPAYKSLKGAGISISDVHTI